MNKKVDKKSKLNLFLELSNYNSETGYSRIVNVDEFNDDYTNLQLGNGGSWCRKSCVGKYKFAWYKNNGVCYFTWNETDDEKNKIEKEFKEYCKNKNIISNGSKVQLIKIFGNNDENKKRPIREDIKKHYKKEPCCSCGNNSDLVCDHKNDLYNDNRVLNTKTQTLDDFQSLCNHCNLQKRQVMKKTLETKKRYGATNIPSMKSFKIDFISGDENFDEKYINAMIGTYWYDPIEFKKQVVIKLTEKIEKELTEKIEKEIKKKYKIKN
jgi:hypothetical protein